MRFKTLPSRPLATMTMLLLSGFAPVVARAEPRCREMRRSILTPGLAATPYVVLTAGGRTGPWLVDFGSTITSVYAGAWTRAGPGEPDPAFDFGLPGVNTAPRRLPVVDGGRSRPGVGTPLGRLGTDVLRTVTTEFHFEDGAHPHVVFRDPSCDRDEREDHIRVGQANVFGAHPETHTSGLPNVPVVFVELVERSTDRLRPSLPEPRRSPRAWAQLDTGYADTRWPHAVDVNEAYLAQLKAAVPSLTLAGLVPVGGCGGEDTLREVYVAPGWRLEVVPDIPQRPIAFDSFHLIVKPRTTACGGIGPMSVPAAQLGASFLRAFRTTVIVPSRAEVQIRLPERD